MAPTAPTDADPRAYLDTVPNVSLIDHDELERLVREAWAARDTESKP